jgi:hypothetical protein
MASFAVRRRGLAVGDGGVNEKATLSLSPTPLEVS